jgi:CRISPR-associated protein Cmr2
MNEPQKYFHFTIGPVQGFVSQARRTRDFWAGSFLLSWLSGVAMIAVEKEGGTIVFPEPPQGYLAWLTGNGLNDRPRQGAIPNRFKARVPDGFDAGRVAQTVREAWLALAEHVWRRDLQQWEGTRTREIWERQHTNFWEISWVLTDDLSDNASDLLDRRKNWRNHFHRGEEGIKCMVMEGWQELSGIETPHRDGLNMFWNKLREQKKNFQTDLVEGEYLCALAFVKRRFARHFETFVTDINGLSLQGWKLETGMPSVAYMAAVHWLEALLLQEDPATLREVLEAARELDPARDEWETRISCLERARRQHPEIGKPLISIDANVFFEHARRNRKIYPSETTAQKLETTLKTLTVDAPLSPFYAILLMDGDSLGSHLGNSINQPKIAGALNSFAQDVSPIVQKNNGFLVYAGGDDVLAILPLEDAFSCAKELRDVYLQAFKDSGIPTTLSGAIEFAHVKMPLGRVLADAHDLLDKIAKDGRGRDAIAVRVWKPGGSALTWSQPWHIALGGGQIVELQQIARTFEQDSVGLTEGEAVPFSNKFFYRIRERFEFLNPTDQKASPVLSEEQAITLLAAEYLSSGVHEERGTVTSARPTLEQARGWVRPLLKQCRPVTRVTDEGGQNPRFDDVSSCLEADGALLVRFLAHKGIEPRGKS